jgi:hypothetical protein
MVEGIESVFPRLRGADWQVRSRPDHLYSCIAWAAHVTTDWWWPVGPGRTYWPEGVPRVATLEVFRAAFATLGYAACAGEELEPGFEKIALFANDQGIPKHAARQRSSGCWTSKLGRMEDIDHALHDLEGTVYGLVMMVMKRPLPTSEGERAEGEGG